MRFLIIHAYSASNSGDGLLVDETLSLLESAFGGGHEISLLALHPDSFELPNVSIHDGSAGITSPMRIKRLIHDVNWDLILAVGGGYLRSGTLTESAKTALAHFPQLYFAVRADAPVVYLPQSIGPMRYGLGRLYAANLRRANRVYLRDDVSAEEFDNIRSDRSNDMALMAVVTRSLDPRSLDPIPVLSVRAVRGRVPPTVVSLARTLKIFDGYVQSRGAGNDDVSAMDSISPRRILDRVEMLDGAGPRKVVVAVRLHASLMALAAGHFVIHLAYERKGFGAYQDLGLSEWVHPVSSFDPEAVAAQATRLLTDENERTRYEGALADARATVEDRHDQLVEDLRSLTADE